MIGPLVILMANLLDSIVPFTLLLLTTTFGFSLAFRILFSKKVDDIPQDVHDFDSTIRIAETLFFSTIGNIEADVGILYVSPLLSCSLLRRLSIWRLAFYLCGDRCCTSCSFSFR